MKIALLHLRNERPHDPQFQTELDILNNAAVAAVESLGWEAELLANGELPVAEAVAAVSRADAVVVLGGEDVMPQLYGGPVEYPGGGYHDALADTAQIAAIHAAVLTDTPLLGICRGLQLINVAFGGTLVQHIESNEHRGEGSWPDSFTTTSVDVADVTDRSGDIAAPDLDELRQDIGTEPVFCTHHQAVDRLGQGLQAVARAADGIVEAVVHETSPVTGVQWHPEHPETAAFQLTRLLQRLGRQARARSAQCDASE